MFVHVSLEKKVIQRSYKDSADGWTVCVEKIIQHETMFPDLCAL